MSREGPKESNGADSAANVAEEDALRAYCYGLLARLLRAPPDAGLLAQLSEIKGDETDFGAALSALAAVAKTTPDAADDEYTALFIGVGTGELVPYASYYLTGFLNEKPLATLRADMRKLGIARAEEVKEPEDHIAALCEMMSGLITGAFGPPADLATQRAFFDTHLARWAGKFFQDLETAKSSVLFAPVGTVGKLFMEIEAAAFEMAPEGAGARRPH